MRQERDEGGEVRRDERTRTDSHEDTRQRDADLDEGKRRFCVLEQTECRLCVAVTIFSELLEAAAVAFRQRRLNQGEEGIGKQQ